MERIYRKEKVVDGIIRAQIPQLTTDRLLLRGFRPDDFERYAEMMADPDVSRHLMDGRPLTRAEAWRQLAMFAGHWVLRGYGLWAVEERATGEFLGRVGVPESRRISCVRDRVYAGAVGVG